MIATAFIQYQDLKLVCNDAHFARYLLLDAAIVSLGFIACLLLEEIFISSRFVAYLYMSYSSLGWFSVCDIPLRCCSLGWLWVWGILRLTAALAGLVALWFVAYLSFDPTLFGLGLAAYLALEIALCSALLLAASLLPVEAILSVCWLSETSFFLSHISQPLLLSS